jgi:hypothetical protein
MLTSPAHLDHLAWLPHLAPPKSGILDYLLGTSLKSAD